MLTGYCQIQLRERFGIVGLAEFPDWKARDELASASVAADSGSLVTGPGSEDQVRDRTLEQLDRWREDHH